MILISGLYGVIGKILVLYDGDMFKVCVLIVLI